MERQRSVTDSEAVRVIASTVSIPHYCDLLVPDDSIDSPASEESGPVKHSPPFRNPKRKCTQPMR